MKIEVVIILSLSTLLPFRGWSQGTALRILPEGGLSQPLGDFKADNIYAGSGFQGGLNLDLLWGRLGIGLYGGIQSNQTEYKDGLPTNTNGLIPSRLSEGSEFNWSQFMVGLGPILKFNISEKLDLELSPRFGFSKLSYPQYAQSVIAAGPLNQEYLMYETMNEDVEEKINPMLRTSVSIGFKPSESVIVSLGANYTHTRDVLHSYSYLDGGFSPDMNYDQLVVAFREAPTVTELKKCHFNSVGITLGVGIILGGKKDKPKDEKEEEEKMEPPVPQYPEDGSTITPEEADSLVLEWVKETPNVENANYNLWLYQVQDSTRGEEILIFNTKVNREQKLKLPDNIQLRSGFTYSFMVQAVDDQKLKPCPDDCYSTRSRFAIGIPIDMELHRSLDGGFYIVNNGNLRFKYNEEYLDTDGKLTFNIYNDKHEIIASNSKMMNAAAQPAVVLGDNRYALNLLSCAFTNGTSHGYLGAGYYVLEVINEKNEKWYLRFKHELTFIPNCPVINQSGNQ